MSKTKLPQTSKKIEFQDHIKQTKKKYNNKGNNERYENETTGLVQIKIFCVNSYKVMEN
jgi:hypothetical protein